MPEMVFEYILRQNGIDPSEVNIDQSIDFGATVTLFQAGRVNSLLNYISYYIHQAKT